jgi:hypothetical protein
MAEEQVVQEDAELPEEAAAAVGEQNFDQIMSKFSNGSMDDLFGNLFNKLGAGNQEEQKLQTQEKMGVAVEDFFEKLAPGGGGFGEIMKNAMSLIKEKLPKNDDIGSVFLNHLKSLYIEGKTFNLYYKDDFAGICVYDPERNYPEQKYLVMYKENPPAMGQRDCSDIKRSHPFFFTYRMFKEKCLSIMIKYDLAEYVLEFTQYFKDNETPDEVLEDFKNIIIESKIIDLLYTDEVYKDIDMDMKNKLKERFESFL